MPSGFWKSVAGSVGRKLSDYSKPSHGSLGSDESLLHSEVSSRATTPDGSRPSILESLTDPPGTFYTSHPGTRPPPFPQPASAYSTTTQPLSSFTDPLRALDPSHIRPDPSRANSTIFDPFAPTVPTGSGPPGTQNVVGQGQGSSNNTNPSILDSIPKATTSHSSPTVAAETTSNGWIPWFGSLFKGPGQTTTTSEVKPATTHGEKTALTVSPPATSRWTVKESQAYVSRMVQTRPAVPLSEATCLEVCATMRSCFSLEGHTSDFQDAGFAKHLEALTEGMASKERQEFVAPALFTLANLPDDPSLFTAAQRELRDSAAAHLQSCVAGQDVALSYYKDEHSWVTNTVQSLLNGQNGWTEPENLPVPPILSEVIGSRPRSYYGNLLDIELHKSGMRLKDEITTGGGGK
ncbi:hypothetical protein BCR39DRAFT_339401 [Naematelia encephala]|uniref:Uncharacterized protein n=1 Tax=Naematelia encephala TaxID=71784 RepID=A0A1Y2ANE5_9TREE|nr:hypothetical protein BCR39DRAFT_339401 [Naematelia encephala]